MSGFDTVSEGDAKAATGGISVTVTTQSIMFSSVYLQFGMSIFFAQAKPAASAEQPASQPTAPVANEPMAITDEAIPVAEDPVPVTRVNHDP